MIESVKLESHEQYSLRNTIEILKSLKEKYPQLLSNSSINWDYRDIYDEKQAIKYLENILEYF